MDKTIQNKQILLVEDEYSIRDLYKIILESAGFNITFAEDGEKGWEMSLQIPDLILLDILLPKINGLMLLKRIKENDKTKNIPVVLLTNLGQESIIKEAFNLGARGYMLKVDLKPKDLVNQVIRFLTEPDYRMNPNNLVLD